MKRKITKNRHQYKVSLPVELLRKLGWNENTSIRFQEVELSPGKGLIIRENKTEVKPFQLLRF